MVTGPEESTKGAARPCRVCSGFGEMYQSFIKQKPQHSKGERSVPSVAQESMDGKGSSKTSGAVASTSSSSPPNKTDKSASEQTQREFIQTPTKDPVTDEVECPEDAFTLGRKTWSFLHTMAAYYPEKPSQDDKRDMTEMMRLLSRFYPCHECAEDFGHYIQHNPPDVSSQARFSQWMCRAHNAVNAKLGKPEFDCSKVLQRWIDVRQ